MMRIQLFPRVRSFWFGLTLPIAAARLIASSRALLFWSALPIALTLAAYFWLVGWIRARVGVELDAWIAAQGWNLPRWVDLVLGAGVWILLVLVAALSFSLVSGVVASPFNDLLAERVEPRTRPPLAPAPSADWVAKVRLLGIDLAKSLVSMVAIALALVLSWIPVVNLLAATFLCLVMTFQYVSYPQTRRNIGLRPGAGFVARHFWASLGFGLSVTLLFTLPVISSLALPVAVVGGTLLFARAEAPADFGYRLR